MIKSSSEIAEYLLKVKAVRLQPENPFTWSSGWKSPIYCDNRVTLSYPDIRKALKLSFSARVREHFPECTALAGVATAGIALGALAADALNLPYAYCRPKPKEHGLKNQLEGRLDPNAKIVVVEDLISTGGSSLKVVEYLRSEGYHVIGLGAIFTYGFYLAEENFKTADCPWFALSNYFDLLQTALSSHYINAEQLEILYDWRLHPETWGQ